MISEAITIDENKTIGKALKLIKDLDLREIVVTDEENKYKGIVRLRDLITEKNLKEKLKKVKKRDCKVYEINEIEIAKRMIENDCYLAALLDKENKVKGIIKIDSLLEIIKEKFGNVKAEEIETKNIIILQSKEPIYKAIKYMAKYNISHIPLIENKKLVGIVSSKDITDFILKEFKEKTTLGELIGKKLKIFENPIISIATKNVITYSSDEKISNIIKKMFYYKISCVVNENLQGIITKKDLLKVLIKERKEKINVIIIGKENIKKYYSDYVDFYIKNFIKKIRKIFNQGFLKLHIEKHRDIYTIHLIFSDYKNRFVAIREGREFLEVLQECFDIIKNEIFENYLDIKKEKRRLIEYLKYF
ncbi:MAG: CBS domain-containing protein [Candidatus Aenigmatarchaeota archaeon]